jgi:hypothetical protein
VCNILEACATTGVSLLQFGDLYVEFGPSKEASKPGLPDLTQQDHDKLNNAQAKRDVQLLRELEEAEEVLTDPEAYEERLIKEATGEI